MNTTHFEICPVCTGHGTITPKLVTESREVRGESFVVQSTLFECGRCQESFEPLEGDTGIMQAREQYRRRHGMVQPAELTAWRKVMDLSQADLAVILGWSPATVSRYENGKLQEPAHDKALRLVMLDQENLLELVSRAETLPPQVRERLVTRLQGEVAANVHEKAFVRSAVAAEGKQLFVNKLVNLVLLLADKAGQFKTKMNKLLFYSDFKAEKELCQPITGIAYERHNFGPVPSSYELLYAFMETKGLVELTEESFGEVSGVRIKSLVTMDASVFTDQELAIIYAVKSRFEKTSAFEISELSHKEKAWLETGMRSLISYEHAKHLSI